MKTTPPTPVDLLTEALAPTALPASTAAALANSIALGLEPADVNAAMARAATATAPRYCPGCGSRVGLDCGDAEPDRPHRGILFCSAGCVDAYEVTP